MVFLHPFQDLLLPGLAIRIEAVPGRRRRTAHGQGGDGEKKQDDEGATSDKPFHGQPAL